MVEYLLILSLVQGITEFLPISSSAHLMILNLFSEANDQSVSVDLSLHIGSLLALIVYFLQNPLKSKKIANFNSDFLSTKEAIYLILFSALPTMAFAYIFLNYNTIYIIRENIYVIVWCNLIFAILLFFSDYFGKKSNKRLTKRNLVFLSVFQSISLIPGVSRSGICITVSRFLGFGRTESSIISTIMSFPILFASLIFIATTIYQKQDIFLTNTIFLAITLSFLTSYLSIKIIIEFIDRIKLYPFVIYRVCLSLIILYVIS